MSNTQLEVVTQLPAEQFSSFGNIRHFEDAQRMALALCSSSIIPETYRGKEHIGDCLIALEMSNRIGASVLSVMQNLYIVHGRPAWSSQFLISCINASKKFSPLRYRMTGEKGTDSWGCIAWATDNTGEKLESPEITIAMAKAEGWYQRNGSKWKTLPELMLRYRTATLFARLYAPELTMGIQTDDEVVDIAPVVTETVKKRGAAKHEFEPAALAPAPVVVAEEPKDKPEPKGTAGTETTQGTATAATPAGAAQPGLDIADPKDKTPQQNLEMFMTNAAVGFDHFRRWAEETDRLADASSYAAWTDLPTEFCAALLKDARSMGRCVVRCKTY